MGYGWRRLDREEELVLALIRGEEEEAAQLLSPGREFNFPYFMNLAFFHRLTLPLLNRLLDRFTPLLPESAVKSARLLILQQTATNKLHRKELIEAAALLSGSGFDVTLMKGLSYDPTEETPRVYGDIDLLIPEERIGDAIHLMEGAGYTYKGSFILSREEIKDIPGQLSWNNQYQFYCPRSRDTIEIHTNLFERDRIRLEDLTTLLDSPDLYLRGREWNGDLGCHIPSPEAALLLLCLHCSMKRSLYNDRFILRHITDMDILFARGVEGEKFLALCRESRTCFHAAFSLRLYQIIRGTPLPGWYGELERRLTRGEAFLVKRHLKCLKNLRESRLWGRIIYNFTAPFIIGGSGRQRYTWIRNYLLPTRVQQENRYYRWGFRKESPLIYLTYLINPFQSIWRVIKGLLGIKDKPFSNQELNR